MGKYDDIIDLNRPVSKHPKMSNYERAAQFAPFAALVGYDDEVKETARIIDGRIELDDEIKIFLNNKLQKILSKLSQRPKVSFTYFVKDDKKDGGKYITEIGIIKKVEEFNSLIILENGKKIKIDDIIEIESEE